MKDKLQVVKLGGKLTSEPAQLQHVLKAFSGIEGKKILVHGGARNANHWARKMNIEAKMKLGRRITDSATLDIVTMVYAGLLNKNIVSQLQGFSCNAIGLSGADGNLIVSEKRSKIPFDYGYAGDIVELNIGFMELLLEENYIPVICPITHNGKGQLLNTNADTIASEIAAGLGENYELALNYCFEYPGVLKSREEPMRTFESLTENQIIRLKDTGVLSSGMIPKIDNALRAAKSSVDSVWICGTENLIHHQNATQICS